MDRVQLSADVLRFIRSLSHLFRRQRVYAQASIFRQACSRRYEMTHDDILLETFQAVDLPEGGGIRENARRFLKRGG